MGTRRNGVTGDIWWWRDRDPEDPMDGPDKPCGQCGEVLGPEWFPVVAGRSKGMCRRCKSGRMGGINARRRAVKAGQGTEEFDREEIFERDQGLCWWCGRELSSGSWHLDHLVPLLSVNTPVTLRPGHVRHNVVASCSICNWRRGNRHDAWPDLALLRAWYRLDVP